MFGHNCLIDQLIEFAAHLRGVGVAEFEEDGESKAPGVMGGGGMPSRQVSVAQADQVRAELEYRQAQVRLQQLENQVRIEVRNAHFDTRQNRASVDAAQAAVDFQKQTLDADQKKLTVGVGTSTAVLQDESSLTAAESNLVSAMAAYEKSEVEMDRATGLLLDHAGIVMADAERGQVTQMPSVPYVVARENPQSVMPPPQPQ